MRGIDGEGINPTAPTLVACHEHANEFSVNVGDEKPLGIHLQFPCDLLAWIVLRSQQIARAPQFDHRCFVRDPIRSDLYL
jgi:hypothetical protein